MSEQIWLKGQVAPGDAAAGSERPAGVDAASGVAVADGGPTVPPTGLRDPAAGGNSGGTPLPLYPHAALDGLRADYRRLWSACVPSVGRGAEIDAFMRSVIAGQVRYALVAKAMTNGMPWYVVGLIHGMEGGFDWHTHLHNGDPLTARTVHEPQGRPLTGTPPFLWGASALDALLLDGFEAWRDWSVEGLLYKLESYNGLGYRHYHPQVLSPYLWSFSNLYTSGKYGSDGKFDLHLVSQQPGCAVVLKRMADLGVLDIA